MTLNFTAIDFETANSSSASACSVGMVKVRNGIMVDQVSWFIRPPAGHNEFWEWNTRIHGIVEADVADALGWSDQLADLVEFADGDHLVAHNAGFDMGVISGGCTATDLETPSFDYACSLQVARKTYRLDSYKLPVAASAAGFDDFAHHNALADAQASAAIMIHAAKLHEANDLEHLAAITATRIGHIGTAVGTRRPLALG